MKLSELQLLPQRSWPGHINGHVESPLLDALDTEIALTVIEGQNTENSWLYLAAALCHQYHRNGQLALDLREKPVELEFIEDPWPTPDSWAQSLANFTPEGQYPFVYEKNKLYLKRAWLAEAGLATYINELLNRELPTKIITTPDVLKDGCAKDQIAAIEAVHSHSLITLSGGPGTGKTFTVLRCMANILVTDPHAHIAVTAPTGKAVSRLNDSIEAGLDSLSLEPTTKQKIPRNAVTLHRLYQELKPSSRSGILPPIRPQLKWLFIDEASMVDLELLYQVIKVLPKECRLYLIGDINQLASVRPGAVFRDLYEIITRSGSQAATSIQLSKTYRFAEESALHKLNETIRTGRSNSSNSFKGVFDAANSEVRLIPEDTAKADAQIQAWIEHHILPFSQAESLEGAFKKLSDFMVLSATNRGPYGAETLNDYIEKTIKSRYPQQAHWKPVLIEHNDYAKKLYNGDLLITQHKNDEDDLHYKLGSENELQLFTSRQLPAHKTAFGITIHKSQGSEANHVLLFLPHADSPLLTRELVYTAVSRARKSLTIVGSIDLLEKAIRQSTHRESSLAERTLGQN